MAKRLGFGLVEVLVSLALLNLILLLLFQTYYAVQRTGHKTQGRIDQEEELIWVQGLIKRSLMQAGYTPCASLNRLQKRKALSAVQIFPGQAIILRSMSPRYNTVSEIVSPRRLKLTTYQHLRPGQKLIIADCRHAELVEVASVFTQAHSQFLTLTRDLQFIYEQPVYVGRLLEEKYSLKERVLYYQHEKQEMLTDWVQSLDLISGAPSLYQIRLQVPDNKIYSSWVWARNL